MPAVNSVDGPFFEDHQTGDRLRPSLDADVIRFDDGIVAGPVDVRGPAART